MPYINLDFEYIDHPKTKRLIAIIGPVGEIMPVRAWLYCAKYHERDGRFSNYSEREIESCLSWRGDPGKFVRSMVRVGFFGKDSRGYYCHDWKEHQGHISAIKDRNKLVAVTRWEKIRMKAKEAARLAKLNKFSDGKDDSTSGIPQVYQKSTTGIPLNTDRTDRTERLGRIRF